MSSESDMFSVRDSLAGEEFSLKWNDHSKVFFELEEIQRKN